MPSRRTFLSLTAATLLPLPAFADDAANARTVIEELLMGSRGALEGCCPDAALKESVERAFDFDIWERFLLQKRAGKFSDADRDSFRKLLPGFLAHLYRERFDSGTLGAPVIGDTSKVRGDIMVSSKFQRSSGKPLPVDWRLRNTDGQMRVIDIMVAGTSFLLLKRDEFQAIIDDGGPDALLSYMSERAI